MSTRKISELAALTGQTILVTGAGGMLGRAFQEALAPLTDEIRILALTHESLDVTDETAVLQLADAAPDIILHCAGAALADQCERDPGLARAVHVDGTRNVARLAARCGSQVFYPQSVFIFDGQELPVTEATVPTPRLTYGRMKLEAEQLLLEMMPTSLVVRMAGFFGGDNRDKNFVGTFTRALADMVGNGTDRCEVGDRVWQPTYTLDLAHNILLLLTLGRDGIYHMGAAGEATFLDVARVCVEELALRDRIELIPCSAETFATNEAAFRPHRMVTATERLDREGLNRQRPWDTALREYLARPYFDHLRSLVRR